jgi:hypothetical protein
MPAGLDGGAAPEPAAALDLAALYDAHPEYAARRQAGSLAQALIDAEVRLFKLPNLQAALPGPPPDTVIEIGCATGELLAAWPLPPGGWRIGVDISARNVAAAQARFGDIDFRCGDFRTLALPRAQALILSDVLEHVPDDRGFLRDAAALADLLLLNLPLEDNWLNRGRRYGPDDVSGHLRRYSLADGLRLIDEAGLELLQWRRVWVHESPAEPACRALRRQHQGAAYAGAVPLRVAKRAVFGLAGALPPLGRRLFASNLFAAARPRAGR